MIEKVQTILNVPLEIKFDIEPKNYIRELGKRNFDAFIIATSMSYKVLGETMNLAYASTNPKFLDPTSKIKKYMHDYQSTDDIEIESKSMNNSLKQMVTDSECVPLYYYKGPGFYNNKVLDLSDVTMDESLKLWRLRVKK